VLAIGAQVATVTAWLCLLAAGVAKGAGLTATRTLLVAVTVLAAATCLLRGATRRADRGVWLLLGVGLAGYAAGFAVQFDLPSWQHLGPFGLHLSDTVSLVLYPCGYAGLLLLARARAPRRNRAGLVDGAVVATGAAAVVLAAAARLYPTLLSGGPVHVIYALAYPVGGFTLLVATVTGLAVARWRTDRVWGLLAIGFGVMTLGDAVYGLQSAAGTFRFGTPLDAAYTAGPVCVALAAWRRPARVGVRSTDQRVVMIVPGLATLLALAVLVAASRTEVPTAAVDVAAASAVLALVRTALFLRQDQLLEESRRLAATDELTGLDNRRALLAGLARRLAAPVPVGLLLVDLDGFKEVNDSLGHAAGDELLVIMAQRLAPWAGSGLVARLGGDEFAVVVSGDRDEARGAAVRVRLALEEPAQVAGVRLSVAATVGVAVVTRGDGPPLDAGELVRRADVALYRGKALRTGVEDWHAELDTGSRERMALVGEARNGLQDGQFRAWFQPKVDATTLEVVGLEVLTRWQHPRRGLLAPGAFLAEVETAGLLPALTREMLDQALAAAAALDRQGNPLPVAVNVGAPDLLDVDLVEIVVGLLTAHRLPAARLRIEVTETVVMSDPGRVAGILAALRDLGVGLSLDDYGTGLASLSYLRALPVDELKIDRSFVERYVDDWPTAVIVNSTVQLAHALGLTVVAEGIEDAQSGEALRQCGCDVLQGYHHGRPSPNPAAALALAPAAPAAGGPAAPGPAAPGPAAPGPAVREISAAR